MMMDEIITIGETDFNFSDLQPEAQIIVQRVRMLRDQQQQLQIKLIESERTINAWAEDLHELVHAVEDGEEDSA
jgi:hypothetical protein